MELVIVTAKAVAKIFIYLSVGFIASKAGIFSKEGSDATSKLLIYIFCPVLAMASFLKEYDPALLKGMLLSLGLELLYYLIAYVIGRIIFGKNNPNMEVERACTMYHNCGFIGMPIASMVLGAEGVVYQAIRLCVFQFVFFTQANMMFAGKVNRKELLKSLKSPSIICASIGLVIFVTQFQVPSVVKDAIIGLGNAATPVAMIIAGGIIARTDMIAILKRKRMYLVNFLKLIALPMIMALICKALDIPRVVSIAAVIAAACPQANFPNIYAEMYDKDAGYSLGIFGFGTLASMVTIPLMIVFYGIL